MRDFGHSLTVGVTGSYMRSASLIAAEMVFDSHGVYYLVPLSITPVTNARYGGIQATRKLGRRFNAFANYTAIDQSSNMQIAVQNTSLGYNTNILNGLTQVIGFGVAYSPREIHLRK